jgi:hypothetical protein
MKIAILHMNPDMQELLAVLLHAAPETQSAHIETLDAWGLDPKGLLNLAKADYAAILLPLRLPFYGSLRLAETLHLTQSPSRLVLVTGSPLREDLLLRLFDRVIRGPCSLADLRKALWEGPPLHRGGLHTRKHVEAAIAELLQKGRYVVSSPNRLSGTFEHYRATFYPYYPFTATAQPSQKALSA